MFTHCKVTFWLKNRVGFCRSLIRNHVLTSWFASALTPIYVYDTFLSTTEQKVAMALVSGPGRPVVSNLLPDELQLAVDEHVRYIQSLDTVRCTQMSQIEIRLID
jgi:hypothetical protein